MTLAAQYLLNIVNVMIVLNVMTLAIGLYMLPTIIAVGRFHPNAVPIGIVNAVLGWTGLGFLAALVWSFTAIDATRTDAGCT